MRLRVLHIADQEQDLALMTRHLTQAGHDLTIHRVDTPDLMKAALEREEWDVVLCDYSLPHFHALAALQVLKDTGLDIPFIIISGTVGESVAVEAMRAGAHDYLMNDNLARLAQTIEREMQQAENRRSRKHAEESLKASEAELSVLFAALTDVMVLDRDGRYLKIAPTTPAYLHKPPSELLGKTVHDVFPKQEADFFLTHIRRALDEGCMHRTDYSMVVEDGREVWLDCSVSPMTPDSVIWIGRDVTEAKRSEKALTQSDSRKAAILQSALDCVVTIDAEGKVIYFNPAAESTFGYTSDEAVGKRMSELIIPARLRGYHDQGLAKYLATGHSTILGKRIEVYGMRSDGNEIPLELTITAIGELPRPIFTAFIRDLTERKRSEAERKQAEEELRKSEERYRISVENAHDIIYEHDLEGKYTSINKAGEQITGYTLDETLKLNIADTVAPEHVNKARQMIGAKLAGQSITAYELEIIAKDGRRIPVEVNTSLVFQNGIPIGVQGIARDVTERKHLEEQLRQSQKMEAIGQLAGGVAHDFNNLLTVIGGYSSILLIKLPPDSPFRASVEEIKKASDRASGLTRQLLAFSRKQILQPRILDLNTVVSDLDKMLRRLIGEHIDLLTITDPNLDNVKADPGQLEQVLLNLVVNARDAMPEGGKLTIETRNAVISKDYAQLHGIPPGPYIMLTVSDTGCGMEAAVREHIFEPFFTTKEAGKGTGLGLATLYGIIKQSGGNVRVYSELGHGTTFKIYLPRAQEFAEIGELTGTKPTPKGTETVLLVEDEEQVRAILKQILENQGYHVLSASQGEEALAISQEPGDIQLMITDVVMPQMSGRELAERMLSVRPSLRVLFMSGYTDDAIVRHGLLDEKLNFIQKPFDSATVARKVRDVLDSHV